MFSFSVSGKQKSNKFRFALLVQKRRVQILYQASRLIAQKLGHVSDAPWALVQLKSQRPENGSEIFSNLWALRADAIDPVCCSG